MVEVQYQTSSSKRPLTLINKLSIVIPVYNEEKTIQEVIDRVALSNPPVLEKELIVIDNGSTDGTKSILREIAKNVPMELIVHAKNMGKGGAVRAGLKAATGDVVIIQDADLEYDPADYPKLLAPIITHGAEVVFGSRFQSGPRRVLLFWHLFANNVITSLSNILNNLTLTDMATGYKVLTRRVVDQLNLRSSGFEIEPEITAKVAKGKFLIYEVPITYSARDYSEGKKITWMDGFVIIAAIIRFRFLN